MSIGLNAKTVYEKRYSWKDENGRPTETWDGIANRVVKHVGAGEKNEEERIEFEKEAYKLISERKFIPNTPCLINAGKSNNGLSACYVLPVPDSIRGIMKTAAETALIHKSGGGTGFSYERIRPAGTVVNSSHGEASGPVSFMRIVDTVTDVVKQSGVRRGANMAMMSILHPDCLRFLHCKNNQTDFLNFNISLTVTDKFMEAVQNKEWFDCEFDGKIWNKRSAYRKRLSI